MPHAMRVLLVVISLTIWVGAVQAVNHSASTKASMDIHQGLVTAILDDLSLREALRYVSDGSGVEFRVDKAVMGRVTIFASAMGLASFVRHLLKPYNFAMVYSEGKPSKLLRVDILASGSASLVGAYETIRAHQAVLHKGDTGSNGGSRAYSLAPSLVRSGHYGYGGAGSSAAIDRSGGAHHSSVSLAYPSGSSVSAVTRGRERLAKLHHDQGAVQHRMVAEVAAIHAEQSRLEAQMRVSSPLQQLMLVKQLNVLSSQEIRSKQKNSQRLLHIQKMIKDGLVRMPHLLTVKQVAGQNRANMIRQHDYALQKRLMVRR